MFKEHSRVILLTDVPEESLQAGDVGVVVHIYPSGKAYEVEFFALDGSTICVATLLNNQLKAVSGRDIMHVRELA